MGIPHVSREELPSFPGLPHPTQDHLSLRLTFVERQTLGVRGFSECQEVERCVNQEGNTTKVQMKAKPQTAPERKNMGAMPSQAHSSAMGRHPSFPLGTRYPTHRLPSPGTLSGFK